ncbi:hypothetical protein [Antrihabitans stalactiti]|uniref:Uncharacterized protein n=1 Tax=Antrihabitans stalactiti TaxID=2584121 RepID=A0A848KJZ0_9NOCA|nr:hypothetical protein [Antrihabitans stalactiti]NMN98156.1 hypothetical protein [Antrihabitans stalactiti]
MFLPSYPDLFDRFRLESAEAALADRAASGDRDAIDAARCLLDLGISTMEPARLSASPFQVQPHYIDGPNPLARATRVLGDPDVVRFSLDGGVGSPIERVPLAIVWFNLESMSGGVQRLVADQCVAAGVGSMRSATVVAGKGGVVAAMVQIGATGSAVVDPHPGFVYLH